MKKSLITALAFGLSMASAPMIQASGKTEVFKAPEDLSQIRPQLLCAHYTDQNEAEQKRFYERLHTLGLLSHKDYDLIQEGRVEPGSSMCGMYMGLGKPLHEEGMQIRPMVFKVVHIYEDQYVVTQSGMVMEVHERKEGELPPSLNTTVPKVAPPPLPPQYR